MSDADLLICIFFALAIAAGALGGAAWSTLLNLARRRDQTAHLQAAEPLDLQVRLTAPAVDIPLRIATPEPLVVPVQVAPAPGLQELARRILDALPDTSTRQLAAVLDCAVSTAHGLIQAWKAGELQSDSA